jgi:hypothetical protein
VAYGYITLAQLRGKLLQRLQDAGGSFTTIPEANVYITEALRLLNVQTALWSIDYEFMFNPGDAWKTLNVAGSPRQRTVTDSYLYSQMEAMLMEPMTGGAWTGTNQYNIDILSAALQYRRDELLLQSGANPVNLFQDSPLLSTRSTLPDSTLDLMRVRWLAQDGSMPYVLGREDIGTINAFDPQGSIKPGPPASWRITSSPPLTFDLNNPPNQPGLFDMLASYAGAPLNPPAATLVGIPDDWTPALIYGALADVLANSPEGRDSARAKYCLQRYEQLKKAMLKLPWLLDASVAAISVDTPSFEEMDSWAQDWEQRQNPSDPQIVVGGVDLVALAPFVLTAGPSVSAVLTVVGNAPVPVNDGDYVQLSRDGVDAVLGYCQHICMFKAGGKDFALTAPMFDEFEAYCRKKNSQYAALGIFRPAILMEGNRGEMIDPRFEMESPGGQKTR